MVIVFRNCKIFGYKFNLPKGNLISSITNLVYQGPHELPNDLRLRDLGKLQVLKKYLIWVKTDPVSQFHFRK